MKTFKNRDIDQLDYLYRINLINSCSGYKSANLIGTKSKEGITNAAVFSSIIHLGSNPALLGFILRPTTVPRNTYKNIKSTGIYTINPIAEAFLEDAHHTSAKYDDQLSEFDFTELTESYKDGFDAPVILQSPIHICMHFVEEIPIKRNGTILMVGEIETLYVREELLDEDGFINLNKGKIATINGLDGYSIPKQVQRFGYQRPKIATSPCRTNT